MIISLRIVVNYDSEDYIDEPEELRKHVTNIQKQLDDSEFARELLADYILNEFPIEQL